MRRTARVLQVDKWAVTEVTTCCNQGMQKVCCNIWMVGSELGLKKHKSIDPSCSVSMVKDAAGGVTVAHFKLLITN